MSRFLWVLVVLVGGACLATQSRINGELAARIGDGVLAALISFSLGLALLAVLTAVTPFGRRGVATMVRVLRDGTLRWWYVPTGLLGACVVVAQGLAVPALGVALFTVCIVAGQSVSGIVVDRIGVGVLRAKAITVTRVLGAIVTVGAVSLGLVAEGGAVQSVSLMLLAFGVGTFVAVQQSFGGQVQFHTRSALVQTFSNFLVGTVALVIVVLAMHASGVRSEPLPGDWWLYLGGPLGCVFVAVAAVAVHHIGVLMLSLTAVAGQVAASLVLDLVVPTEGHAPSAWSFAGAALAFVGVAISAIRVRERVRTPA